MGKRIVAQRVGQRSGHRDEAVELVVEEGRTRQRELREALRMLHPTPLLGTVLNKAIGAPTSSGYYGYGGYRRNVASTPVTRDPVNGGS